ncbi:MAG: hypothetical protein HPY61_14840 [Methanotrichaceae archaeon]|nr:hypothetical protein [Methanotrichaceae archaeon]
MKDFTDEKYSHLCQTLVNSDYDILTVRDYLLSDRKPNIIILRHDVDGKPEFALRIAQIENQMGIKSSYYFRHIKRVYNRRIIKSIHDLDHEIGFHYEVLSKTNGDYEKAIRLFEIELNDLREICEVDTICMHGNTLSRYDNRDLWKRYDFTEFNLIGEAYLSMDSVTDYFSDTGHDWSPKHKLRDLMPNRSGPSFVETTDDLLDFILKKELRKIYILSHPEIWADNSYHWWTILAMNKMYNFTKRILSSVRSY